MTNLWRQRNALIEDAQDDEDEALMVPVLAKKASEEMPWWAKAMAFPANLANGAMPAPATPVEQSQLGLLDLMLGGAIAPAAFLGGLHVTRKAYNNMRRQDLRQSLQDEQKRFEQLLRQEAAQQKSAMVKEALPSTPQLAGMAVLGMIPLTALTAAMLTKAQLDKTVPSTRVPLDPRLRLRTLQEPPAIETVRDEDEEQAKAASLLIHAALDSNQDSGLRGLCGAAVCGMLPDAEDMLTKAASAEEILSYTDKAAAHFGVLNNPTMRMAAVKAVASSAMRPIATKLAAAELLHMNPTMLDDEHLELLTPRKAEKFAAAMWDLATWSQVQQDKENGHLAEKLASAGWNNWQRLRSRQLGQTGEQGTQGAEFSRGASESNAGASDPIDAFLSRSQVFCTDGGK